MSTFNINKLNTLVKDFKILVKQNLKLLNENENLLFKSDKDDVLIKKLQKENEQLKRLLLNEIKENKQIKTKETSKVHDSFIEKVTSINIYC